jgi:hypothetical protein
MPSREEMLKKLRRQDMIDRLRAADAKAPPAEDKPWYKSAVETVNDLSDKFDESMTLGFLDEMQGGISAGVQKLKGSDRPIADLYREARDAERLRLEEVQKRSPTASMVGTLAGGFLSPNPVGKVKGLAGIGKAGLALGAEGAAAGLGYSDAELNSTEALKDAAVGGALNTAIPGAAGLVSKGARKVAPEGVSNLLRQKARERATKAATGNQAKYAEPLRRKGKIEERGKVLIDEGIMDGSPAAFEISERAAQRGKEVGKEIESILSKVDEIEPGAVNSRTIADKILDYAAGKEAPKNKAFVNKLMEEAGDFEAMGDIPMAEAQRLKRQYKWDDRDPAVQALGPEATNKVNRIISDALEESVERVEKKGGDDIKGLLDQYKSAKNRYGHLAGAAESSEKLASRQDKNRTFSLSDYLPGLGIAGTTGYGSQDTATGLGVGAGAAMVNRALRRRGSAAAAKGFDRSADAVETLSKKTKLPQDILDQGRSSLAATRAIMESTDENSDEIKQRRMLEDEKKRIEREKRLELLRQYQGLRPQN